MASFFRENLPYKIAALIFAVLLHSYAANQSTPTRVITVPLHLNDLPRQYVLSDSTPRQIAVTLTGPSDALYRLTADDLNATADLSHVRTGNDIAVPAVVNAPPDVQAYPSPSEILLSVLPRDSQPFDVQPIIAASPLPGYRFGAPRVDPRTVVASGSKSAVLSIARVAVDAGLPGQIGAVDGDYPLVALDARGEQISNISLTPSQAHVRINMLAQPAERSALITPNFISDLPAGESYGSIAIRPGMVVISGSAARVKQIAAITTTPVTINGPVGPFMQTVECIAPPGITFVGAHAVQVTVQIAGPSAAPPAVPIPPAASAPASPGP